MVLVVFSNQFQSLIPVLFLLLVRFIILLICIRLFLLSYGVYLGWHLTFTSHSYKPFCLVWNLNNWIIHSSFESLFLLLIPSSSVFWLGKGFRRLSIEKWIHPLLVVLLWEERGWLYLKQHVPRNVFLHLYQQVITPFLTRRQLHLVHSVELLYHILFLSW